MWRILGLMLLLATVGLATCQSLLNSGPQRENPSGQRIPTQTDQSQGGDS